MPRACRCVCSSCPDGAAVEGPPGDGGATPGQEEFEDGLGASLWGELNEQLGS